MNNLFYKSTRFLWIIVQLGSFLERRWSKPSSPSAKLGRQPRRCYGAKRGGGLLVTVFDVLSQKTVSSNTTKSSHLDSLLRSVRVPIETSKSSWDRKMLGTLEASKGALHRTPHTKPLSKLGECSDERRERFPHSPSFDVYGATASAHSARLYVLTVGYCRAKSTN